MIQPYQRNDNLAIRVSLEVVLGVQVFPENTVVVNLAVDGEGEGLIIVDKGLSAGVLIKALAITPSCPSEL